MAPFKAFAGPSPNCCAVFVQMEHWAKAGSVMINKTQIIKAQNKNPLFIAAIFHAKILTIWI